MNETVVTFKMYYYYYYHDYYYFYYHHHPNRWTFTFYLVVFVVVHTHSTTHTQSSTHVHTFTNNHQSPSEIKQRDKEE